MPLLGRAGILSGLSAFLGVVAGVFQAGRGPRSQLAPRRRQFLPGRGHRGPSRVWVCGLGIRALGGLPFFF